MLNIIRILSSILSCVRGELIKHHSGSHVGVKFLKKKKTVKSIEFRCQTHTFGNVPGVFTVKIYSVRWVKMWSKEWNWKEVSVIGSEDYSPIKKWDWKWRKSGWMETRRLIGRENDPGYKWDSHHSRVRIQWQRCLRHKGTKKYLRRRIRICSL